MNYPESVSKISVLLIVDFTTKILNNKQPSQKEEYYFKELRSKPLSQILLFHSTGYVVTFLKAKNKSKTRKDSAQTSPLKTALQYRNWRQRECQLNSSAETFWEAFLVALLKCKSTSYTAE